MINEKVLYDVLKNKLLDNIKTELSDMYNNLMYGEKIGQLGYDKFDFQKYYSSYSFGITIGGVGFLLMIAGLVGLYLSKPNPKNKRPEKAIRVRDVYRGFVTVK